MQTTSNVPTAAYMIGQADAQHTADAYLRGAVATDLETASACFVPGSRPTWRMLVRLCQREPTATVGTLEVDAQTGTVLFLTEEDLEDMRDRRKEQLGEASGVLRPTAQVLANGYLADQVSLFAKADRPVWVANNRPVWRATVFLRLRGQGRVCDLGTIDVDAQTGAIIPLTNQQLQVMRKHACDAAERTPLAATSTR